MQSITIKPDELFELILIDEKGTEITRKNLCIKSDEVVLRKTVFGWFVDDLEIDQSDAFFHYLKENN